MVWLIDIFIQILGSAIFSACYTAKFDTSTRGLLAVLLNLSMGCLSGALPFLLGYMKKHARECFEQAEGPRKRNILILFIFVLLGLFLVTVRLY